MDEKYFDGKLGYSAPYSETSRPDNVGVGNRYSGDFGLPNDRNAFTETPRKFRSEQGRRFSRWFGNENEQPKQSAPSQSGNIVIYSPSTYEDVQTLIDHLKNREQVIVDFSNVNQAAVYRILDFMSGAIYALNGSIQQITRNIFLFAPAGVTISVPPQLR